MHNITIYDLSKDIHHNSVELIFQSLSHKRTVIVVFPLLPVKPPRGLVNFVSQRELKMEGVY